VELGPYPAAGATDQGDRGLDSELPLAACNFGGGDLEAVQAKQPGGRGTTVLTHLGPPVLQTSDIRKLCEASGALLAAPMSPSAADHPTLHDEEPVI
jgi:hypothetical protein